MHVQRRRRASAPALQVMEARSFVSTLAGQSVAGNAGRILSSQFQPYGYSFYGSQLRGVTAALGRSVRLDTPFNSGPFAPTPDGWVIPTAPANTGLLDDSQFNTSGFSTLGFQMRDVSIGGAFVLNALDEGLGQDAYGGSPRSTIGPNASPHPIPPSIPDTPTSSGSILGSQFNDGGFGNVGLQWDDVSVGGDLNISYDALIRYPDGEGPTSSALTGATALDASSTSLAASTNTGLVQSSQFNDGGFGNLGLQWANVNVTGAVDLSADRVVIQPQATGSDTPPIPPFPDTSNASATNTGHILSSQFNDGGFGQIGFQWSGVKVGGVVATSNNALIVQPERDGVGTITVGPLALGQATTSLAASGASDVAQALPSPDVTATANEPTTNAASNSGTVASSQFADGGFGDIGLQWKNVAVVGAVTAVHNQLSIQPENNGQGQITVQGISFPSTPVLPPPLPAQPDHIPAADPALISEDGQTPTTPLPTPTEPGDRSFHVNQASNSGNVIDTQFADGGFGDVGLQWTDVSVSGSVAIVHNSLSVQPEGSGLAGVAVSGVTFGDPVPTAAAATPPTRRTVLRRLAVPSRPGPNGKNPPRRPVSAQNRSNLTNRQFLSSRARDVTLQWSTASVGADGLVIVHNVLTVENHGPRSSAIVLKDIKFPGRVPPVNFTPNQRARASARPSRVPTRIIDQATNSGTVAAGQFLDGGTGDVGLQWRGVNLGGDVRIVHNSLSVNVDADASKTGPMTISNITFNSGLPDDLTPTRPPGTIISPPRYFSRLRDRSGTATPNAATPGVIDQATNSGTITGGQFLSGGMGQVGLQWLDTDHPGPVTIVNNVLSVQVFGGRTGRVTIENVQYT